MQDMQEAILLLEVCDKLVKDVSFSFVRLRLLGRMANYGGGCCLKKHTMSNIL